MTTERKKMRPPGTEERTWRLADVARTEVCGLARTEARA
ncbi:hypothetical protein ES332_D09G260400v1 [Gossypium tomentosum]|uniref:Uncharacterized protein n=1 Tax=Gossypium tomentosum TaxID=34277 RepID=A0A5D2JP05_GOSTO|nr:hypothetical protein ES332_D09G260400v1 [Gossypium tomentosum]